MGTKIYFKTRTQQQDQVHPRQRRQGNKSSQFDIPRNRVSAYLYMSYSRLFSYEYSSIFKQISLKNKKILSTTKIQYISNINKKLSN